MESVFIIILSVNNCRAKTIAKDSKTGSKPAYKSPVPMDPTDAELVSIFNTWKSAFFTLDQNFSKHLFLALIIVSLVKYKLI